MKTYAIIALGGKQYQVSEGDRLVVDRVDEANRKGENVAVEQVLLVRTEADTVVGTPYVPGATVTLKVVEEQRGEKLRIFKYKAKSRYRRTMGHRQEQTVLDVVKIVH